MNGKAYELAGERIRKLIDFKNMDVETFGNKCGMASDRIKCIVMGTAKIKVHELVAISKAFDVSVDYLVGNLLLPLPIAKNKAENELYNKISLLNAEELLAMLEAIRNKKSE